MDPILLTVYKSPFQKIRLGRDNDGGYVVIDLPNANYPLLLSCGIASDISFEEDFINKYKNTTVFAFDGTINNLPKHNDSIFFFKKNIDSKNSSETTNLHNIINLHSSIFLKMDIEGFEIPWIKSLNDEHMNKFEQIVMEFHYPFYENEIGVFDKINKTHYLVHFHGNNNGYITNHRGVIIPNVFECTFLHKKYFTTVPELNTDPIPSNLDMKNNPNYNEIFIDYPPFVNKV
jgi:hypothetical protein